MKPTTKTMICAFRLDAPSKTRPGARRRRASVIREARARYAKIVSRLSSEELTALDDFYEQHTHAKTTAQLARESVKALFARS